MSLKQLGSLTLVALCLAACSSSGGGSSNNLNAPDTGNNNNANNKHADKSVPKLLKVSDLREDTEEDLEREFHSPVPVKLSSYAVKINGKTYTDGDIDYATLGNGLKRVDVVETASANINGQTHNVTRNSKLHLYQQPYSIVTFMQTTGGQVGSLGKIEKGEFKSSYFLGQATETLPSAGSFNYKGVAFNEKEQGKLDYTINFDTKKGAGSISGLNQTGKITLHESNITKIWDYGFEKYTHYGVEDGKATSEKQGNVTYDLGIFGPNADEVSGTVSQGNKDLAGFGGKKQ